MTATNDDGLGLEHGTVRLERARSEWKSLAAAMADDLARAVGRDAIQVEHIGSTSIPGLLAKPVIDLAMGIRREGDLQTIRGRIEALGWIYRDNAGAAGGHVFVLNRGASSRIAHLHVIEHDGDQWHHYLALRDRLLTDAAARSVYEQGKLALVDKHGTDNTRRTYTVGKTAIIEKLLDG